jgi:hypothetical protein
LLCQCSNALATITPAILITFCRDLRTSAPFRGTTPYSSQIRQTAGADALAPLCMVVACLMHRSPNIYGFQLHNSLKWAVVNDRLDQESSQPPLYQLRAFLQASFSILAINCESAFRALHTCIFNNPRCIPRLRYDSQISVSCPIFSMTSKHNNIR